jgi:undecaprenyl-diphosphatase
MEWIQIVSLAIVQGLTEFLPISSSAHLVLVPSLTGWPDQGLAFDVAVHVGSLLAVLLVFRQEVVRMLLAFFSSVRGRGFNDDAKLAWAVGFATIPVGLAGLLFGDWIEQNLRSIQVLAWATIGFGLLLGIADRWRRGRRTELQLRVGDVLWIGLAQALALIPGTSRSGITMTAALFLGFSRQAAARFSFLLSIPVILLAGGLEAKKLVDSAVSVDWSALFWGVAFSAISAWACICLFLNLIERIGMAPFVAYRVVLGGLLLMVLV